MTTQDLEPMFDRAARQFNSNLKALDEDVLGLEEWLNTQPHLPKLFDKNCLRNFLILNKCSIEIAKQKIDNYFSIRAKLPEIALGINPKLPYHRTFNEAAFLVEHPQLTDEMYRLTFFQVKGESLPESYEPINFVKKFHTIQEMRMRDGVMCGDVVVVDYRGFPLSIALKVTPMLVYKTLLLYERILSARLKAVHSINTAPYIMNIVRALKSVIKPKVFERLHFHPDLDSLKKVIRPDLLPVDFGGEGLSLQELEDALEEKYRKNQDLFDRIDKIKVDESLRPQKLEDSDFLGFYGNFKKLEID
ncbi:alpha-tocopherol transfer protein-like [Zophobas morio]|uniref:alpha-tocopherol transfer protein-like n=1 Tax=Zophobas morio TaxID=2755281 RepID=UPI0030837BA4